MRGVRPVRRRLAGLGLVVLAGGAATGVSACGATPPQSVEHSVISGVNADVGSLEIRNATISLSGSGGGAVDLFIYNNGSEADTLQSASAPFTTSIALPGGGPVPVPAAQPTLLNTPTQELTFDTSTSNLVVGIYYKVTLSFAGAGSTTLSLPVVGSGSQTSVSPSPVSSTDSAVPPTPQGGGVSDTPQEPVGTGSASAGG